MNYPVLYLSNDHMGWLLDIPIIGYSVLLPVDRKKCNDREKGGPYDSENSLFGNGHIFGEV